MAACVKLNIDKTAATITATVSPAPVNGVNYGSATVTFTCADALSGVATCSSPVTDTTIGANQKITGTATDKAGNSNSTSVTLNIQATVSPTITATPSPAANANGWNNTNVTVTFTCTAGSYPIQTCPASIVVSTAGSNQSICGHAVDTQGNSSLPACVNVNLDKTPPTITAAVSPSPVGGINYGSATVTFTCSDALSGVATCPSPISDTTIGANQSISGTATDKAGNSSSASVTLNIQPVVLPTITATPSPAPNANGWNDANVTVSFTCTAGSYAIQTCPAPIVVSTEGANQSTCAHAVDTQGNPSLPACASVSLDKTPPTITAAVSPAPVGGINYGSATVTFTCSDALAGVATCPSPITDTTIGANQNISGTATDKAGNSNSASVTLNIQSVTPPAIVVTPSPAPNAAGWNNTNVTVSFACTAGSFPIKICPSPIVVSSEGKNQSICGTAVDTQGNSSSPSCVNLNIDKTPPTLIPNLSPAPNAGGWETSPVTVSFTCSDSLSGVALSPSSTLISSDGANQPVSGSATDVAGNTTTVSANVNLEQARPTISASVSPSANSSGWNNTNVTVTFNCNKSVSNITSCTSPQTVSQGIGQVITGTVQDQAGNQATTSVTLNIDETPPTVLQLTAPSQLSPGQTGSATVTVSDTAPVAAVVFQLNGSTIGTVLAPPYTINVTAPSNANSGSTLTLTAVVTDVAGNSNSASKGIQVVSAGVIVGEVLSDATGLPLAGANLQVIGQASQNTTSDSAGRYSIPVTSSQLFLSISEPGSSGGVPAMVNVERQVSVQSGVGTVPVDARMTALAAPVVITAAGGSIGSGAITMTVPAGGSTTSYYLTPLSQQGLPGLLPLGWSPVAAFDLQTNISTSVAPSANFTGLPAGTLYLVVYSYSVHAWNMVTPNLSSSNGSLAVAIPSTGDYALVMPDAGNPSIQIPATGQPLTGLPVVTLPTNATSTGSLSPANIAPTGGTSMASLAVQSGTSLPSGTVIQGKVTETYTLTTGQLISDEPRYEDILLYQNPAPSSGSAAAATFPVTPSQTFQVSQLASGDVHLDILSGRESVRGATGGSDPVSVQSGDATLTVAGGSLPQDTAIAVTPETINTFLPSTSTLVPLSEYYVDFSDAVLSNGAQLTVGTAGAAPGTNVVIAEVQRVSGVPYLVVVSMAQVTATNIISQATPGLPGITQGGDYVFYQVTVPTGFVTGTVSAGSGPVAAMVQTDALPFVAFSNASGNYTIIAAAGTVNLTASVANTALAATTIAQVTAGQTATANLTVAGQVEAATVTPANGALGVPLTAEIDITASAGFNQATVTSSSVVLTAAGSSTPIAVRFVFSNGGATLAVFPQAALQPSTQYTLQASGIANAVGGLISVPTISFTTVAINAPIYNTSSLVFAMPDLNGNVAISAAAGSFPSGSKFLIVDQTNGVVYSLTVFNDGSVTGSMPATINDILQVALTDPSGNVTNFTVSQFVAADGTTAVGLGGGTVTGPGGTGIFIPAGALTQGVTFNLTQLDQTAFPTLPTWQGANFGSGLRINDPAMPTFQKEAKLAFPVPANAPSNAFYYVYRRLTDQNGNTYFETIDEAFVQGTGANAQVVTASPPFCGYHNSFGNFSIQADSPPLPVNSISQDYFVMWDDAAQHGPSGVASTGLIVGLAQQTVPAVLGQSAATTEPAQGTVTITIATTNNVAIYDGQCATFSVFDPQLGGGPRTVTATQFGSNGPITLTATADEVDGAQSDDGLYAIYAGLEDLYKNIGRVNFLFPPATPPPPPPAVSVQIFTLDQNGHRVPAGGILQAGTNVVIAFQSSLTVQSASISGTQLDVETPDSPDGEVLDNLPEQHLLNARVKNLYPLGAPGSYTITATGIDPLSLTVVTASQSILVVAAGGSNTTTFTCAAAQPPADPTAGCTLPQVVSISPTNNATSVSPAVFPVITFSEPVTNISSSNVVLTVANVPSNPASQIGMVVPVVLVGVRVPNPNQAPIADPVSTNDVITSLTIEPANGLGYNETYTLTLNATAPSGCLDPSNNPKPQPLPTTLIVDQNQAPTGPFCLPPYGVSPQPCQFTTFGPQDLGGVSALDEVLTRPVIIGNTAYAGEYLSSAISGLGMFDVTDPTHPKDLGPGADFVGRAIDIAGLAQSPVTGGALVAISAGTAVDNTTPANVWLYDVSTPTTPNRVGAVSVTSDTSYGIALRLFMKDQYLYASTFEQGLQVIDLGQAIAEYSQTPVSQFGQAVSTAGDGFAMDAITNTIPIPLTTGGQATMLDLKADNFATNSRGTQTLVVAAGQLPFVMVDPTLSGSSAILYPPSSGGAFSTNPVQPLKMTSTDGTTNSLLCYGQALDIGTIAVTGNNGSSTSQHIAVVVGNGMIGPVAQVTSCPTVGQTPPVPVVPVLAAVNVTAAYTSGSPFTPQLVGLLQLPTTATDVTLNGTTVLISTGTNVLLVSLENPAQPTMAGQITGNFGNWLTTNSSGLIVGSNNNPGGGIQVSSLGVVPAISVDASGLIATPSGTTSANIPINYNIFGDLTQVSSAQVNVIDDTGTVVFTTPVPVVATGSVTWPAGATIHVTPATISFQVQNPDGGVSDFMEATAENDSGTAPTPVILSTTPNTIVVNSPQQVIDIKGRNFLVSTQAEFFSTGTGAGGSTQLLPVAFISSTEVQVTLAPSYFLQITSATLRLLNGTSVSNDYAVQIVPEGLPPALTITSINPAQLPVVDGAQDTSITLTGTNFVVGDTVVKTDSELSSAPPLLTAQVISPTSMQVTIPGYWQATPTQMSLYVQSTQYPVLVSQALPFQIGSGINYTQLQPGAIIASPPPGDVNSITDGDPNFTPPAASPILSAVGDGAVALAASGSTQPISVTLQGSGFETGNTVVVDVDGLQTSLSPSSVSANQIQVNVPASDFQLHTYTFDFQVNPQGQQQQPLHAQQHNNVSKMIFRNLPQYRVPGNSYHLGGFHERSGNKNNPNQPLDYFLMVPEQNSCAPPSAPPCSNAAEAVLTGQALSPGAKITFDQANAALLNVNPASTQSTVTTVTGFGTNEAADGLQVTNIVADQNAVVNGANVKTPLQTLQAQLLQRHHYAVYLHYVTEVPPNTTPNPSTDPNFACGNLPLRSSRIPQTQQQYDNIVQSLEAGLNNIYTQQANVQFDVYAAQGSVANGTGTCDGEIVPEQVHYDLNNDSHLLINPINPAQNPEESSIIDAIQVAHPPQMPAGVTRQFHIYFVQNFLQPLRLKDLNIPGGLQVGTHYSMTVTFTGGVAPYQFAFNGDDLPPGLVPSTGNAALTISGVPTAEGVGHGQYTFVLTVNSQDGQNVGFKVIFPQIVAAPGVSPMPQWDIPPAPAHTPLVGGYEAFVTQIGGTTVFVDDLTPTSRLVRLLGHELGHALNMNHPSEKPGANFNANNTCVPNLPIQDSDYSDANQLMWWVDLAPKQQTHLGIQQLWQMNGNLGTACHF